MRRQIRGHEVSRLHNLKQCFEAECEMAALRSSLPPLRLVKEGPSR